MRVPTSQKRKLWAIHPFSKGMEPSPGMAPPRTVPQEWLSLFVRSSTHYAPKRAGAMLHLLREAPTLGSQKPLVFRPCGVSPYLPGCGYRRDPGDGDYGDDLPRLSARTRSAHLHTQDRTR